MTIFAAAFLLSLDGFFASLALGAFGIKRTRYIPMAVAFGLCDGVASLIGTAFGVGHRSFLWMTKNGLVFDVVTCLVLIFVALRSRKGRSDGSRFAWAAPVALCLDNLASPFLFPSSFASVVVFILVSSFLSLLGFELAAYAKRKLCSSNPAWPKMPASLSMRNMKAIVIAGDVLRLRAESELP
jgi:putative Mn2+ efflux pump MntP